MSIKEINLLSKIYGYKRGIYIYIWKPTRKTSVSTYYKVL